MEIKNGIKTFYAKTQKSWRQWLAKNHLKEKSVWLILYKKDSGVSTVTYQEAVDEALCFGWIDSKANKRDEESYYQYFAKRKPKGNWSRINKEKVARFTEQGRMAPAGLEMIEIAKQNGSWNSLDDVENKVMPPDLLKPFKKNKTAFANWEKFSPSSRKVILFWISSAKQSQTRQKRIEETVRLAAENIKAH